MCKERDQLKAQIDPSSVPVVQNLRAALTEGLGISDEISKYGKWVFSFRELTTFSVKMLTPDHTLNENESAMEVISCLNMDLIGVENFYVSGNEREGGKA